MTDPDSKSGGHGKRILPDHGPDQTAEAAVAKAGASSGFRISRDGTWFYQGSPIGRKALVQLFSTVLRREHDGSYWLVTPLERVRVEVDDAPFTAVEVYVQGHGTDQVLRFRTNLDQWVEAGPDHPIRVETAPDTGEPSPYILVRDGLEALIVRPVFYELVERSETKKKDGKVMLGVWSKRTFFPLGDLPEAV